MSLLLLGLVIFIGVHLVPSFVAARRAMIDRLGAGAYKGLFSLLSFLGLALIVLGKYRAGTQPVWLPPAWGRDVAMVLLLAAFVLLAAAYMPSNFKRFTRHPMLWAVVLWSAGHLLATGDRAALLLFGSLGLYALVDMVSANRRGAHKQTATYPPARDVAVLLAGVAAYVVLLLLHPYLFGAAVLR